MAIFNDLHDNHPLFAKLTGQIKAFDYDFSIFNGDCFADPVSQADFVSSLKTYNAGIRSWERPVVYQRGNHEYRGAFARQLRSWFAPPGGHFYGAFTAGPVRFIMLDAGEDRGATVMMLEVTTEKLSLKMLDVDGRTVETLEIPAPDAP